MLGNRMSVMCVCVVVVIIGGGEITNGNGLTNIVIP